MKNNRFIDSNTSIIDALKIMDTIDRKLLIVLKDAKFYGLLSIGDIQRAIIKNISLEKHIFNIIRKDIKFAKPNDEFDKIKSLMLEFRMELCPVVDENNNILNVYYWEELFKDNFFKPKSKFNLPIIIMAGGLGSRLKPLTNVIPKPLVPLGEKTMIEHIFEKFMQHGSNSFHLSVNYKSDLIEYYLKQLNLNANYFFYKENIPLGTAGSLSLLKQNINETFFITNCDILIDQDYSEILDFHKNNENEITIVAAIKNYSIPYGVLETSENGRLNNIIEKPNYTFKINSGMYILEPHLLKEIPENTLFHITDLIEIIKNRFGKIGVFPVSEKSWRDIGVWDEYLKNMISNEIK